MSKYPEIREFILATHGPQEDIQIEKQGTEVIYHMYLQRLKFSRSRGRLIIDHDRFPDMYRYLFICFDRPVQSGVSVSINNLAGDTMILPTSRFIHYIDFGDAGVAEQINLICSLTRTSAVGSSSLDFDVFCGGLCPTRVDEVSVKINAGTTRDRPKVLYILAYSYHEYVNDNGRKHDRWCS